MKALFLITLLSASVAVAQAQSNGEQEIREIWGRFAEAYESGDAAAIARMWAPDADRITTRGTVAKGREEMLAVYEAAIASRKADPRTLPYNVELSVRMLTEDVGILDGVSKRNEEETYQFTVIFVKYNGEWLIAAGRPRGLLLK